MKEFQVDQWPNSSLYEHLGRSVSHFAGVENILKGLLIRMISKDVDSGLFLVQRMDLSALSPKVRAAARYSKLGTPDLNKLLTHISTMAIYRNKLIHYMPSSPDAEDILDLLPYGEHFNINHIEPLRVTTAYIATLEVYAGAAAVELWYAYQQLDAGLKAVTKGHLIRAFPKGPPRPTEFDSANPRTLPEGVLLSLSQLQGKNPLQ